MTSSHRKAMTVGLVVLSAAGLSSLVFLAFSTSPVGIALGCITAASFAGLLALRMTSVTQSEPPSPVSSDSLHGNEERLRLLESAVIHAHDAVVVMEAEPREGPGRSVLYVNDAFCNMTGYDRAEVVGRSLHFLRGPDSDPATLEQIRVALDQGQPLRVELRNYRKDGTGFWVDLSLVPVPDPDGRAAHWVMIQRDITDRRAASDALRRSEERYRLLFDSNPHPMWVVDRETHRFLAVNDAAVHKYGYSRAEFLRMTIDDIRQRAAQAHRKTESPSHWRHRIKDGAVMDVEISSFHLTMDGRPAE